MGLNSSLSSPASVQSDRKKGGYVGLDYLTGFCRPTIALRVSRPHGRPRLGRKLLVFILNSLKSPVTYPPTKL